jgi:hypothetical protein
MTSSCTATSIHIAARFRVKHQHLSKSTDLVFKTKKHITNSRETVPLMCFHFSNLFRTLTAIHALLSINTDLNHLQMFATLIMNVNVCTIFGKTISSLSFNIELKSLLQSFPKVWNYLDDIKLQSNKNIFKISLCDRFMEELVDD